MASSGCAANSASIALVAPALASNREAVEDDADHCSSGYAQKSLVLPCTPAAGATTAAADTGAGAGAGLHDPNSPCVLCDNL